MANNVFHFVCKNENGKIVIYNPQDNTYAEVDEVDEFVGDKNETSDVSATLHESMEMEPSTSTNTSKATEWDSKSTLLFINKLKEVKFYDNQTEKKIDMLKKISQYMGDIGYTYTAQQCNNKLKSLLDAYRKVRDHNNTSGAERKAKCKFYDAMEDLLGERPNITPIAPCSSKEPVKKGAQMEDLAVSAEKEKSPKAKKRKIINRRTELMRWLEKHEEKVEAREAAKLAAIKAQQAENSTIMRELINVLKSKTPSDA